MPDNILTIGTIVHYVMMSNGENRPAIVTRIWGNGVVNLQVFTDGNENLPDTEYYSLITGNQNPMQWRTSVSQDENDRTHRGTWHFPE